MQQSALKSISTEEFNRLCQVISKLSDLKEIEAFLCDLMTIEELADASNRLEIAQRLINKETFRTIAAETKASTATITRINYWLRYGTGGYRRALKKLAE